MKLLLASLMFISLIAPFPQDNCGCMPAAKDDTTRRGGNEFIVIKEKKVRQRLFGTVNLIGDNPIPVLWLKFTLIQNTFYLNTPEANKKRRSSEELQLALRKKVGNFVLDSLSQGNMKSG